MDEPSVQRCAGQSVQMYKYVRIKNHGKKSWFFLVFIDFFVI